jgi:intracellular sulfur oxidation DsrE/DsrF family protein
MHTDKLLSRARRSVLKSLGLLGGLVAARQVQAMHTESHLDDTTAHRVVYQCNKADPDYLQHILFSAGEMLRKYGDDIEIVIVAFAAGIHLVGERPVRPVPGELQQQAASLAQYGVAFHACGNTMKTLGWSDSDLLPFATVVPVGADDLMLLQEKGFAYISW